MSVFSSAELLFWLACGALAAGSEFAFQQRRVGRRARAALLDLDRRWAAAWLLLGPLALLGLLYDPRLCAYGWLWPWGKKAGVEAGLLMEATRIDFDSGGSLYLETPAEAAECTCDRGIKRVTKVYLTPAEFQALPEWSGP